MRLHEPGVFARFQVSLVCRESETVALAGGQVYERIRVSRPLLCRCDSRRLILTA